MSNKKKILVLISDGVSLRNFVFTNFKLFGEEQGWDIIFWNQTSFCLSDLGIKELILNDRISPRTDLLKRARKEIELEIFRIKSGNPIYNEYCFPSSTSSIKKKVKKYIVNYYINKYRGKKLNRLRTKIKTSERQTQLYRNCLEVLKREKPNVLFCTSQRSSLSIAPIVAAEDLNIPSVSFVFSWDNLPKATMVVESDHYFVWSDHMKKELLYYYPYIPKEKIYITGTPQFEPHFDKSQVKSRKSFLKENNLPQHKRYICFSGDDITTSPHDSIYLEHVAQAVQKLNVEGQNIGIIFRRCPVDLSNRYNSIIEKFSHIIFPLDPLWEKQGEDWSSVLPTRNDFNLLINTITHTECVINVGSSMVFDAICHNKPCLYINYNPTVPNLKKNIHTIYKYIHFQSMPSNAVVWLNSAEEISNKLNAVLKNNVQTIKPAKQWFEKINKHTPQHASLRMWEAIDNIFKS